MPNEKIVGLEGKELSILLSVFLPVSRGFGLRIVIFLEKLVTLLPHSGGG